MALSDVAGITHGAARSSAGKPWKAAGGATTTRVSSSARTSSLRAYLDLAAPAHGARPRRLLTVAALSSEECPWKRDGWAYFSRASTTTRVSTSTRTSSLPAYLDLAAPAQGVRPRRLLTVAALSSEEYPCKREGWAHFSRASSSRRPHALRAHLDPKPRRFVTVVGPSSAEKAGKREGCAYSSRSASSIRSPAQARLLQPLPELPPLPRSGAHAARTGRLFVGGEGGEARAMCVHQPLRELPPLPCPGARTPAAPRAPSALRPRRPRGTHRTLLRRRRPLVVVLHRLPPYYHHLRAPRFVYRPGAIVLHRSSQ